MGKILTNNCTLDFFLSNCISTFPSIFCVLLFCSIRKITSRLPLTTCRERLTSLHEQNSRDHTVNSEKNAKLHDLQLRRFAYVSTCCSEVQKLGQSPMVGPVVKSSLHSSPRCDLEKLPLPAGSAFRLPYLEKAHLCVCICT